MEIVPSRLALNPKPTVSKVRFGPDPEHEYLIVDDVYADPHYVRDLALSLDYKSRRYKFPGYDARISLYQADLLALLAKYLGSGLALTYSDMTFSMMQFEDLDEDLKFQPRPHIDTVSDHLGGPAGAQLAALIYLNLPAQCRGGTGIYKHRGTGLIWRDEEMSQGMANYMLQYGLKSIDDVYGRMLDVTRLPRGTPGSIRFITDSNDELELLTTLEMRFNRMVVYDSLFFHSPYVQPEWFGSTNDTRRLTQTIFVTLPPDT